MCGLGMPTKPVPAAVLWQAELAAFLVSSYILWSATTDGCFKKMVVLDNGKYWRLYVERETNLRNGHGLVTRVSIRNQLIRNRNHLLLHVVRFFQNFAYNFDTAHEL